MEQKDRDIKASECTKIKIHELVQKYEQDREYYRTAKFNLHYS